MMATIWIGSAPRIQRGGRLFPQDIRGPMNLNELEPLDPDKATVERFLSRIEHSHDGHWLWTGYLNSWGYGMIKPSWHKSRRHASRVSWEIANRRIAPKNMCVIHDPINCNLPACVNPKHLRLGTSKENNLDTLIAGTHRSGATLTHAACGHQFDDIVTWRAGIVRRCRQCALARMRECQRRLAAKRRAARPALEQRPNTGGPVP